MNATKFGDSVRKFSEGIGQVKAGEDRILELLGGFEQRLQDLTSRPAAGGVSHRNDVAKLVGQLKSKVHDSIQRWTQRLAEEAPVRMLSDKYGDRAVLLVFGKVNSGKSTFVNFLVDELQEAGASIRGFALEAGKEVDVPPLFSVGATETTARIQGVEVDDRLVFLDSPGLHSVTVENHELTKLFTDSADAVLWLSPSSSPGQVQELRDLKEEMRRKKPLLPVITKSDIRVEDWCEVTGSIMAEIRNKAHGVRKAQEDDVLARTLQLRLAGEVRPVISLSILAYEKSNRSDDALNEAGLETLYGCLSNLVDSANQYKIGKAEQVARNYIEEHVVGTIEQSVEPALNDVMDRSDLCIATLHSTRRKQVKDEVEAKALSKLRCIVDRHDGPGKKEEIARAISTAVTGNLAFALQRELTSYVDDVARAIVPVMELSPDELDDFEDIIMEVEQKKGAGIRSIVESLGGIGGAALGTLVFPGVGTTICGIAGGLAGDRIAKELVEDTEIVTESAGVSKGRLMISAHDRISRWIGTQVDAAIDALIGTIRSTTAVAVDVKEEIDRFKTDVEKCK